MSALTSYQNSSAYTLGRFLGLAQMAADEKTWCMSPENIVATLKQIASEYATEQREQAN